MLERQDVAVPKVSIGPSIPKPKVAAQLPFHTARRTTVANSQAIPHHGFSSNRITSSTKLRGILNAQAGECCSAERKTRSANARNGGCGHHLYGGRRISAAKRVVAGGLAHADGYHPPRKAHGQSGSKN